METKTRLSIEVMADLVTSIPDMRDRAILVTLAKTGMKTGELARLNIEDLDLDKGTIKVGSSVLKMDGEYIDILKGWFTLREYRGFNTNALFLSRRGRRIGHWDVRTTVREWAEIFGYSDIDGEYRLTPMRIRKWFKLQKEIPQFFIFVE